MQCLLISPALGMFAEVVGGRRGEGAVAAAVVVQSGRAHFGGRGAARALERKGTLCGQLFS